MKGIDLEVLRAALRYDCISGTLTWLVRSDVGSHWNAKYPGTEAGATVNREGYKVCTFNGDSFQTHRICWALHHGYWPDSRIDHINGDKLDNRIGNLRLATASENAINRKKPSTNTSGHKGAFFDKRKGKWQAQIKANGKTHFLGYFGCATSAHLAYMKAAMRLHGEFIRSAK